MSVAMMAHKEQRERPTMRDSKERKPPATSRRRLLKAGAVLVAGGAALPAQDLIRVSTQASAQGAADAELIRLQSARRILLKGGTVLTLDRQLGDFAQADVLMEDGKVHEV